MKFTFPAEKLILWLAIPLIISTLIISYVSHLPLLPLFIILILDMAAMATLFFTTVQLTKQRSRSIAALKEAIKKLCEGNYDIDLPEELGQEIGPLTRDFNSMVRQIREKMSELEQERYGRLRSVIDGEEMERQRLSRELHDGIGQLLIAIKLRLESLLYQDAAEIKNSIQELKKYFDQIIDEVRRISNNLMPSVLEAFGPVIAFRNLFSETEEHSGLRIHFEARGDFELMDKKVKTYVYRLTQEALSNIVKHSEANKVWVNLNRKSETVILEIRDNGIGFKPELAGMAGGNGIHNMRERASLLGGQISIESTPGKGTSILLKVPIFIQNVNNQDFPRG